MEHMDLVMMSGQEAKLNMRNPFDSKEVSMKACSATSKQSACSSCAFLFVNAHRWIQLDVEAGVTYRRGADGRWYGPREFAKKSN